jgi:hypothetical protein
MIAACATRECHLRCDRCQRAWVSPNQISRAIQLSATRTTTNPNTMSQRWRPFTDGIGKNHQAVKHKQLACASVRE